MTALALAVTLIMLGFGGLLIGLGFTSSIAHLFGHTEGLVGHPWQLLPGLALWYGAGQLGAWAMDRVDG